jgi:hypothetical protein
MGRLARRRSTSARSSFRRKFVGLLDQRFTLRQHLRRLRGKNAGHRARFPKLLCQSLAVAARKGRGVMLRRHPDIQPQTKSECGLGHIEARPAPILFKSAGALLAGIFEQPLTDILPDRLGSGQPDGVGLLDFDGAVTAAAGDPQ